MKKQYITFVSIGIGILFAGVAFIFLQNTRSQASIPVIEPQVNIPQENTLEHRNDTYGISFRYPEGWEILDTEAEWNDLKVIQIVPIQRAYRDSSNISFAPIAIKMREGKLPNSTKNKSKKLAISNVTVFKFEISQTNNTLYLFEHPTKDFYFSVENRIAGITKALDTLSKEDRFPNVDTTIDITPEEKAELEQAFNLVLSSFSME